MAADWPKVKARHTRHVSPWMAIIEREVEFAPECYAGDDPLSLQAARNSNPKINNVPFTIVPAPIRDKRYIAQSDNCEMPGFPLLKQRACPTVAIAIPGYSNKRCAARRTYRPLTNACAVAEKGGQTNGGLLKGRRGRRAMGSMSGGSISPLGARTAFCWR